LNDAKPTPINRNNAFSDDTFHAQLLPLFLIASIFLLNFTSRIVFAPLLPKIENNLRLTHGDAGSLFLFLSMGYFISLLGSGHISSRINHNKTIAVSAISVGTALLAVSFSKGLFTVSGS
jgi:NNP family nitrate/nitrite transporter-like MFS transporter